MTQLQTNSCLRGFIYILPFGDDGYFGEHFAAIQQTAFVSTLHMTTRVLQKSDFKPAVGYIRLKTNRFYECGVEHCFVTLKAKCYNSKAICTNERQTGHARQNCKKEYMNKTLVLNYSSNIAAWFPHECSQQLMLSFKSTREPNCWSTSENLRATRGAERRSTEQNCVGQPYKPLKVTNALQVSPHTSKQALTTQTSAFVSDGDIKETGKLCKQLQDSEVIPVFVSWWRRWIQSVQFEFGAEFTHFTSTWRMWLKDENGHRHNSYFINGDLFSLFCRETNIFRCRQPPTQQVKWWERTEMQHVTDFQQRAPQ